MQPQAKPDELQTFIDSLDLEYKTEFVPASQANREQIGLNWRITLSKGRVKLETPYFQGIAHVKGYKQPPFGRMTLHDKEIQDSFKHTCENGFLYAYTKWRISGKKQPAPELKEILYCIVSDADSIDYDFEEWAGNYGYDTDSRKAEKMYHDCIQIGLKLRQLVGNDNLQTLRELYQDY